MPDLVAARPNPPIQALGRRAEIETTIARQSEGYFTLNEAAQVLADSRPGLNPMESVGRFRLAHSKHKLPIHAGRSRFPLEVGETIRDFLDLLEVSELDIWLRKSAGYGFPPAAVTEPQAAPTAAGETPKKRRARLLAMLDAEASAGREHGEPRAAPCGDDKAILAARHALYGRARESNPARWSRNTRNWTPINSVTLNRTRLRRQCAHGSRQHRTVGCMNHATTTLTRAATVAVE